MFALVLAAGCAAGLEDPDRFTDCAPGFAEQLMNTKCGLCHVGPVPMGDLDLVGAGVEARLANVVSATPDCSGDILVGPGGGGLFLDKLGSPSCGSRMPLGDQPLTSAELACVRKFVEEIAPQ
jgi:hypothetical protein